MELAKMNLKQLRNRALKACECAAAKAAIGFVPHMFCGQPLAAELRFSNQLDFADEIGRRYGSQQRAAAIRAARRGLAEFEAAWELDTPEAHAVAAEWEAEAKAKAEAKEQFEAILAAMTTEERAKYDARQAALKHLHGKPRKKVRAKQKRLLNEVFARIA